jgi:hypothetical protein
MPISTFITVRSLAGISMIIEPILFQSNFDHHYNLDYLAAMFLAYSIT